MAKVDQGKAVLQAITQAGLNLPAFLDALSYSDAACMADPKVQATHTKLFHSPSLSGILDRWYKPYHGGHNKTIGAHTIMTMFAFKCVAKTLVTQFNLLILQMTSPEGISEDSLLGTFFTSLEQRCDTSAPHPISLLHTLAITKD
jgi:hypothetical protein